jgi:hypothetical protein
MIEPIIIHEGCQKTIEYTWTDPLGSLINVTGYSATFSIREPGGLTDLISLTEANGIVVGDAAGTFLVTIPASFSTGKGGLRAVAVMDVKASAGADPDRLAKLDLIVEAKY